MIFFGNSHTYYSKCVIDQGQSTTFTKRTNDKGLFYQLCKAKGVEVYGANYTFDVHQLSDFYSGSCAAGKHDGYDHMADFAGFNYDYVIVQQGTKDPENDLVGNVENWLRSSSRQTPM